MTLNLRFGLARDGENSWDRRKGVFRQLFSKYPADFVCVQEANGFQADYLFSVLPGYSAVGRREPAPEFWQHNMIYFHESWMQKGFIHFYLSDTPDIPSRFMDSRWPRQCTMALFEKKGKSLVVMDTHFDFTVNVRKKSARLILKRLQGLYPGHPAILAGDFNTSPPSPCHDILTGKENSPPGPYFKDVFEGAKPKAAGTHHGFTGAPDPDRGIIDWILYSGPLKVTGQDIITDTFDGRYPSDHFPVTARFRWK